jgi:hypothetical protein
MARQMRAVLLLAVLASAAATPWSALNTAAGVLTLTSNYAVDAPLEVPAGTALSIVGDATACGGPCVIDASLPSYIATALGLPFASFGQQHIRVGANCNVTIGPNIKLINGVGFRLPPQVAAAFGLTPGAPPYGPVPGGSVFSDEGSQLVLHGVQIASGTSLLAGGCVYASGTLTVSDTVISGCYTFRDGGAIYSGGHLSILPGTVLLYNVALQYGGGIVAKATVSVDGLTCSYSYVNAAGGCLAAENNSGDTKTFNNSVFVGNRASAGAGIFMNSASIFNNCSFISNLAPSGAGGAIVLLPPAGTMVITNSFFDNNMASVRAARAAVCARH